MMSTAHKTLVFDFDGTLIDSAPGILDAFAAALQETGIVAQVPLDSNLIGPPLQETLMRLSGSDDVAVIGTLTERFKQHYDNSGVAATHAYPGITAMLDHFAQSGAVMHIATNKRLGVTHSILEHLGWQGRFDSVYALDMVEPRLQGKTQLLAKQISEQQLDPAATIYIGDKREDGEAAGANALEFFYASWGYGELQREELDSNWNWLGQPADLCNNLQP
jgi:phosphoglycolate phosphatase